MATTEHHCYQCAHHWFDNTRALECPACGHTHVSNWHDEVDDHNDEPREDDA